jgi:hypothetical protein
MKSRHFLPRLAVAALLVPVLAFALCCCRSDDAGDSSALILHGSIDEVQPFTGIVLWSDNEAVAGDYEDSIRLEFSYLRFNQVSSVEGAWDWSPVDELLADIASRGHQAILRFRYEYPGEAFGLPSWIAAKAGYTHRYVTVEDGGKKVTVELPDWSCAALMDFNTEFFQRFAERYDDDARIAYLQVGFGFWSEYHLNIDKDRAALGQNFPSRAYQASFLESLASYFKATPFSVSVDSSNSWGPFRKYPDLLDLDFGSFDDSFLCEEHETVNKKATETLGVDRWQKNPRGGEFSYYEDRDQRLALSDTGPYGISWETAATNYHMSYIIGNDQPEYQSAARIKEAGLAAGYRFTVTGASASEKATTVTIRNDGVAPLYYDAWPSLKGTRSTSSLKGLQPGASKSFMIAAVPPSGSRDISKLFSIACDRLLAGQTIQFQASLP